MFLFNKSVKNFIHKNKWKIFRNRSFENFNKLDFSKQKELFISNYRPDKKDKCENEDIVTYYLNELARKNNIIFNILPKFKKNQIYLIWKILL